MSEGTVGILVLVGTALMVACVTHSAIRSFFLASAVSALITAVLFQVFAYLHAGYVDKFVVIALITSGMLALLISAVVGLCFHVLRRWRNVG